MNYCHNKIIPDHKYGFLPIRSTLWQLLTVGRHWHNPLDAERHIHACFLDLVMAFGRVNNHLMLHKLAYLGFESPEMSWLRSYLAERQICTVVDGFHSGLLPRHWEFLNLRFSAWTSAVHHLRYVRDIANGLQSVCAVFADNTMIYDRAPRRALSCPLCPDM